MRSFRRNQKKGEVPGTDDQLDHYYEDPHMNLTSNGSLKSSGNSPNLYQNMQFTPPQAQTSSSGGSVSSPKKLLTPIRNLFSSSSHSKSHGNIVAIGDNLNNALYNSPSHSSKPSIHSHSRKSHRRSTNSISSLHAIEFDSHPPIALKQLHSQPNLQEFKTNGTDYSQRDNVLHYPNQKFISKALPPPIQPYSGSNPRHSTKISSQASLVSQSASLHSASNPSSSSHINLEMSSRSTETDGYTTLKPPIHLKSNTTVESISESAFDIDPRESNSLNESDVSLVNSEKHFQTSNKVQFHPASDLVREEESRRIESGSSDTNSGSDPDSDTSSQFSFVKDMRRGRNTSVKYYKKAKPKDESKSTFEDNEMGYDEEYSDYDFENNGDFDDEGSEEDVRYNTVLDDEAEESVNINKTVGVSDGENSEMTSQYVDDEANDENDQDSDIEYDSDYVMRNEIDPEVIHNDDDDYGYKYEEEEDEAEEEEEEDDDQQSFQFKTGIDIENGDDLPNEFNKYDHIAIRGNDMGSVESHVSLPESDVNADDILESYLDASLSPPTTNKNGSGSRTNLSNSSQEEQICESRERTPKIQFEQYDSSSPLINGLTIGNNLGHRLGRELNKAYDNRDGLSMNPNNSFIHRNTSNETETSRDGERDIFHQRMYKSFHGSISEDFDRVITSKLEDHDNFTQTREDDKPVDVGLGISSLSDNISKMVPEKRLSISRSSVADVLNLLKNMGTEEDAEKEEYEGEDEVDTKGNFKTLQNKRNSILGLMATLQKVEEECPTKLSGKQRDSIAGMMNLLGSLETPEHSTASIEHDTHDNSNLLKKENRRSINDMMSILAGINFDTDSKPDRNDNDSKSRKKLTKVSRLQDANTKKRYSWFNDDENKNFAAKGNNVTKSTQSSGLRNEVTEEYNRRSWNDEGNFVFDESVIDEANQLPEDFDFEEYQDKLQTQVKRRGDPGFFRSNSYNNKPNKVPVDIKFQSNKIETLNKTVTFYRSGSPQHLDINRSRSVSRAPSTRSTNSFVSTNDDNIVMEEDEEDELAYRDNFIIEDSPSPYHKHISDSSESVSKSNALLGTISESS
ncbi:hypothetical protein CAAN1_07S02080 [[Candida] anglica]|uniref:Uncharacterized protein n=1 Tax=[Candida] anglica TaxID=148631 RepID=A0ABP0EAZ9_9ASCO